MTRYVVLAADSVNSQEETMVFSDWSVHAQEVTMHTYTLERLLGKVLHVKSINLTESRRMRRPTEALCMSS